MTFSQRLFRVSMFGAAIVIAGVATYFFGSYWAANIAISNSGLKPFFQDSSRAMWLGFCAQLAIVALVFFVAALRPQLLSRSIVLLLSLMPILATVMLFWFAASRAGSYFLALGGLLTLIAVFVWPKREPLAPELNVSSRAPGSPLL